MGQGSIPFKQKTVIISSLSRKHFTVYQICHSGLLCLSQNYVLFSEVLFFLSFSFLICLSPSHERSLKITVGESWLSCWLWQRISDEQWAGIQLFYRQRGGWGCQQVRHYSIFHFLGIIKCESVCLRVQDSFSFKQWLYLFAHWHDISL